MGGAVRKQAARVKTAHKRRRTTRRRRRQARVIPGFGLSLGVTVSMLSVLVVIPLMSVLGKALTLSPAEFWAVISQPNVLRAFGTSLLCSAAAAAVNTLAGLMLAWVLVRYDFPCKRLLDGLIELPFALPTAVAGITLSRLYSSRGVMGKLLGQLGLKVSYTRLGLTLALVFVGIPFAVRSVQPVLQRLEPRYEEAARMLGARRLRTFVRVVLPELTPALLSAFALSLARGLGEYGSVVYISGNSARDGTQVVSYVIMQKLNAGNADYEGAAAIALVLLLLSFALMLIISLVQARFTRRTRSGE